MIVLSNNRWGLGRRSDTSSCWIYLAKQSRSYLDFPKRLQSRWLIPGGPQGNQENAVIRTCCLLSAPSASGLRNSTRHIVSHRDRLYSSRHTPSAWLCNNRQQRSSVTAFSFSFRCKSCFLFLCHMMQSLYLLLQRVFTIQWDYVFHQDLWFDFIVL